MPNYLNFPESNTFCGPPPYFIFTAVVLEEMECCDDEMQCYLEIIPEQRENKIQDSRDASEDER